MYVLALDYPIQIKMDDGRWEHGVIYRRVSSDPDLKRWAYEGKNHFVCTRKHWDERFTPVEEF